MKTAWEKRKGKMLYYCSLDGRHVTVGETDGTRDGDQAGAVTYANFAAGQYHDIVLEYFGPEVLQEVLKAIFADVAAPPDGTSY